MNYTVAMKVQFSVLLTILICFSLSAQESVYGTFSDRWVINSPSVEMLPARKMDVRIVHRFGDFGGTAGGWKTFYGIENAADVGIGFEYGISNNLNIGISRTKGAGPMKQLLHGVLKTNFLRQTEGGSPLSLSAFGLATLSTAERSTDPSSVTYFEKFAHRLAFHISLMGARKFSDRLSLQLSAGLTHRNVVPSGDDNNLIHSGLVFRLQVTKVLALIGDLNLLLNGIQSPFQESTSPLNEYKMPLGLGLEFNTGGHVFQLNFTNATGIMPTDYLPYTRSDWKEGQFRIGFTISRLFNL